MRGTARGAGRSSDVAVILAPHLSEDARQRRPPNFEVTSGDLTRDDGWREATTGRRYVLHVASPLPRPPPQHENELIVPARDGALRVLRAAHGAGVARVVMTSSLAAVVCGNDQSRSFPDDDWSILDGPRIDAYEKSKTIAERGVGVRGVARSECRHGAHGHYSRPRDGLTPEWRLGNVGRTREETHRPRRHKRAFMRRIVSPTTKNRRWPGSMSPACTGPTGIS